MSLEAILGIVRHILTAAGGILVTNGYLSASDSQTIVGGLVAIIGVVWSVLSKRNVTA